MRKLLAKFCSLFRKKDSLGFARGKLIQFRCHFDGKVRASWDAIYHGDGVVHSVGKDKRDTWLMASMCKEDIVSKINHGYLICRILP